MLLKYFKVPGGAAGRAGASEAAERAAGLICTSCHWHTCMPECAAFSASLAPAGWGPGKPFLAAARRSSFQVIPRRRLFRARPGAILILGQPVTYRLLWSRRCAAAVPLRRTAFGVRPSAHGPGSSRQRPGETLQFRKCPSLHEPGMV